MENKKLSPKVKAMYQAVMALFMDGADLNTLTVSKITNKAGIGKGTAYEYVSNKEELIAGAIFNQIVETCEKMEKDLQKIPNFYDKAEYMLLFMEAQMSEANYFMQVIHIMSDQSLISKRLYEMSKEKEEHHLLIQDVVRNIILTRVDDLSVVSEDQITYLTLNMFSKMIGYGMYLCNKKETNEENRKKIRNQMCDGICREMDVVLLLFAEKDQM